MNFFFVSLHFFFLINKLIGAFNCRAIFSLKPIISSCIYSITGFFLNDINKTYIFFSALLFSTISFFANFKIYLIKPLNFSFNNKYYSTTLSCIKTKKWQVIVQGYINSSDFIRRFYFFLQVNFLRVLSVLGLLFSRPMR